MRSKTALTSMICMILAWPLLYGRAYGQENPLPNTIVGKVIKIDVESGVITVGSGIVTKEIFSASRLNAELLWEELIKNGYIDSNGVIQAPFYLLDKFSDMALSKKFKAQKRSVYNIFEKALADNGTILTFYISINSDLLRGTHHIASVEIEQGDPVTIRYDSPSAGTNHIISLVDNKPEQ